MFWAPVCKLANYMHNAVTFTKISYNIRRRHTVTFSLASGRCRKPGCRHEARSATKIVQ